MTNHNLEKIVSFLAPALYGVLGASTNYLYLVMKRKDGVNAFRMRDFLFIGVFGFMTGLTVGKFLPESFCCRDGILILVGYMALHLLGFIETQSDVIIDVYMRKALNLPTKEND